MFFTKNSVDIRPYFLTVSYGSLAGYDNFGHDSFSTVPPIVNGGGLGCIVRDLETIIVLLLLAFTFIPKRPHHSLILPRSRTGDSATVTLTPEDGTTAIKVESPA